MYIYGYTTVSYEFADERYNIVRTEINWRTITLTSMLKCMIKSIKRNGLHSYIFWNNMQKNEIRRHEKVLDIDIV